MVLERRSQPTHLYRETLLRIGRKRRTRQRPLDPVRDASRDRVGLPAVAVSRRVLADPARYQRFVPRTPRRGIDGTQIVEVVRVVEPQFLSPRIVPARGRIEITGLVEEPHLRRTQQR